LPPPTPERTIDPDPMPSRATSAFQRTVRVVLHERAADFVMWAAGHGADAPTLRSYLASLNVFPSHFDEWAGPLSRFTILASIPLLRTILPGLTSPGKGVQMEAVPSVPLPPVVATIVTLATQQHIMTKTVPPSPLGFSTANGSHSISGHHAPILEANALHSLNEAIK